MSVIWIMFVGGTIFELPRTEHQIVNYDSFFRVQIIASLFFQKSSLVKLLYHSTTDNISYLELLLAPVSPFPGFYLMFSTYTFGQK